VTKLLFDCLEVQIADATLFQVTRAATMHFPNARGVHLFISAAYESYAKAVNSETHALGGGHEGKLHRSVGIRRILMCSVMSTTVIVIATTWTNSGPLATRLVAF
jgi:hypothetical protein